jgi:hypothetical protein
VLGERWARRRRALGEAGPAETTPLMAARSPDRGAKGVPSVRLDGAVDAGQAGGLRKEAGWRDECGLLGVRREVVKISMLEMEKEKRFGCVWRLALKRSCSRYLMDGQSKSAAAHPACAPCSLPRLHPPSSVRCISSYRCQPLQSQGDASSGPSTSHPHAFRRPDPCRALASQGDTTCPIPPVIGLLRSRPRPHHGTTARPPLSWLLLPVPASVVCMQRHAR